ncbi:MAG: hypothetical protein AAB728_03220 [Patescibacteria group bacterium]
MKMKHVLPVVAAVGVIGTIAAAGRAMGWKRRNGHMAKKRPGAQGPAVQQRS